MIWRSKKPIRVTLGRDVLKYFESLWCAEMWCRRQGLGCWAEIEVRS